MPEIYTSPGLEEIELTRTALVIIEKHLHGIPVGQARQILRQAEFLIDATTGIDCEASEFRKACAGFDRAAVE